jgi:hypothetical protein
MMLELEKPLRQASSCGNSIERAGERDPRDCAKGACAAVGQRIALPFRRNLAAGVPRSFKSLQRILPVTEKRVDIHDKHLGGVQPLTPGRCCTGGSAMDSVNLWTSVVDGQLSRFS